MTLEIHPLSLDGLVKLCPRVLEDDRGFFTERYKHSEFERLGLETRFVQDNHSRSRRGVLRGLHFQRAPHAQGKLVWAVSGRIFDVCVDMRKGSLTFGCWEGLELCADEGTMLYVPEGFAHGFLTLSETADVVYRCTAEYHPASEGGVRYNDPALGIEWPFTDVLLSPKDAALPPFASAEHFGEALR